MSGASSVSRRSSFTVEGCRPSCRALETNSEREQRAYELYAEHREQTPEEFAGRADECLELLKQAIKILWEAVPLSKKSRMTTGELRRHNAITKEGKKLLDKADRCMNELGPVLGVVDENRRRDRGYALGAAGTAGV